MGRGPKRRCDTVVEPDLRESYSKCPWTYRGVSSPMILMLALLADTVPSAPRPKKRARVTSSGSRSKSGSTSRELPDTSSRMPTVKRRRGDGAAMLSNTAFTIAGVNSFDASPYRPPYTRGMASSVPASTASARPASTSWCSGSAEAPGSFVRSSTVSARTDRGNAATRWATEKGRNSRTFTTPTRSPRAARCSTVSWAHSAPEPISSTTRSASGWPA